MPSAAGNDADARIGYAHVAPSNEQMRRRYAEDAEFRARRLAQNRAWRQKHRAYINTRLRE